ncbi:GMC family oxidoreductase [Actinomadura alba]|uniref:GMC family oxidoreductase n=1 Tax=Actinomadura alba TaxID=406431 RepID=UPI0031DE6F54
MEHVDALVVGSGFGGSVAAFRLAEAGKSVVVMERGRDYPPGGFARTPAEMGQAFWDPREGLYGLFDVWSFRGLDSVVSSGLGGGSLIYANVLLRKDEHWFVNEQPPPIGGYQPWPVSRADLDPHYDEVERMLGATPYPFDKPAYADTPKTHAMQDAAVELGLGWQLPPLAVSFAPERGAEPGIGLPIVAPEYGNLHGVHRRTCQLCGECNIGCNDGSKNSLDHTYLSAAKHHGADLRTLHDVRAIRPRPGGGYEVDYVRHEPDRRSRKPEKRTIGCDRLVLGAGTYGTTYLLLRSREDLPALSQAVGTRFCGNGDLLTFLLKASDHSLLRPLDASRGPVITSAIRLPDELDGVPGAGSGGYVEDGGYPSFVDWIVEAGDVTGEVSRVVRFLFDRFRDFLRFAPDTNLSKEISDLIGDGALSVSSLPLLGMGRDVPDGVLRLRDDRLDAQWSSATSKAHFERLRMTMQRIADVLGAEYADNPAWFRKRVITVHPLGGAPMGEHPGEGVCDAYGEVFGHPGLYIADGAAMPGPVGANPSLTIAAMADRMAMRLLERTNAMAGVGAVAGTSRAAGRAVAGAAGAAPVAGTAGTGDVGTAGTAVAGTAGTGAVHGGTVNGGAGWVDSHPVIGAGDDTAGVSEGPGVLSTEENTAAERTSLSFTEEMKGFYSTGVNNPGKGELAAHRERFAFRLTITADDVDRFLNDPEHTARAEGWIDAVGCGGRRPVQRGWFNLFAPADAPDRRMMKYRLYFTDGMNRPRTLAGWKNVYHGPPTDIWPDTSTLYFRLLEGHVPADDDERVSIVGAGTLHIQLADFVEQMTTFRTSGPRGLRALRRFGQFFLGELWDVYRPDGDA